MTKYLKLINCFLFYKNNFRSKFFSFCLNFFFFYILFFKIINVSSAFELVDKHPISVNGSLIIVNQQSLKKYQDFNQDEFNSRVDLEAGYNLNPSSRLNLQLRMSDGNGIDFGSVSSINAVVPGDDDDFKKPVILQGYYSFIGNKKISFDIGQMDPYSFFDGNNYSDDESETFLNLAFIHNPLLDVGGDLNPGTYGGTPGIHLKYSHNNFLAQLGTFGSGLGADFEGSIDNRITISQLTWFQEIAAGLEKSYRVYYWDRKQGIDVDGNSLMPKATGWGFSFDYDMNNYFSFISRYGRSLDSSKDESISNALTIGLNIKGSLLGRPDDNIGIAAVKIKMYENDNERFSEIYYKLFINKNFEISGSFQNLNMINAESIHILSIRSKLFF